MTFRRYWRYALIHLFAIMTLLGSFAQTLSANRLDVVIHDFSSIDGFVVAMKAGEYVIDLDESKGLHPGDLLAVQGKGEPIVHPISGEKIGVVDTVKAVLKVTRIRSGFSFARSLTKAPAIKIGDPVRRYGGLQADFWDHTGNGRPLWLMLQQQIPSIVWKRYTDVEQQPGTHFELPTAASEAALHFILASDSLKVVDSETNLIHEYSFSMSRSDSVGLPSYIYHLTRSTQAGPPSAATTMSANASARGAPPLHQSIDFSTAALAGEIDDKVVMADFIGHAGKILMALTDGSRIHVYTVSEEIRLVATPDVGVQDQVLFLDWWRPSNATSVYLSASIWSDHRLYAIVYVLEDGRLKKILRRPDCMLGSFDMDGDHFPETLLSQQFDSDSFFGYRFHQLVLKGNTVNVIRSNLKLPTGFSVSGSRFADLTQNGRSELAVVRNGILNIYADGETLYTSAKQMGGTLSVLTYKKNASMKDFMSASEGFEVPPVAADIDRDGQVELLTVSSERPVVSAPGAYISIKNVRFVSFKYVDGRFVKTIHEPPFDSPIQGAAVVDKVLFYIVTDLKSRSSKSAQSRLYKFQLNR